MRDPSDLRKGGTDEVETISKQVEKNGAYGFQIEGAISSPDPHLGKKLE
jgi:hypothetical protein